jgi:hypothetical protein
MQMCACCIDHALCKLPVAALYVEQPAVYGGQQRHHACIAGGEVLPTNMLDWLL